MRPRPKLLNVLAPVLCVLLFVGGGHYAATALIGSHQESQLQDLSRTALRRSEAAVEFATAALEELIAQGPPGCDAAGLQAVRLHIYRRGAVKDIRVTDGAGAVRCSAYSETLEFDQGWTARDAMLPTADATVRLFRVDQFFGTALGVLKDDGAGGGLVAVLSLTESSFDIMPDELKNKSAITLELADGRSVARTVSAFDENRADALTITLGSERHPLRTLLKVDRAALRAWEREPYWPILGLSVALGAAFALLLLRLANRPADPVAELDAAIAAGEFRPFLQPIFELDGGRIAGAEILARRVRATGEVVPPSRFIELAERSGRIDRITWQILAIALDELRGLLARDPFFKVSINITPGQFVAPGFADELARAAERSGASPRQISVELTEREAFDDLGAAARVVADVRGRGFSVAIDDVGIGHSGLSQIQKLGADTLKVDKFFVDGLGRDASAAVMVEMLVRLARDMGMTVVAEGIEAAEQAAALLACGVRRGQGYLVSPPVPAADFLVLCDEQAMREALGPEPVAAAARAA